MKRPEWSVHMTDNHKLTMALQAAHTLQTTCDIGYREVSRQEVTMSQMGNKHLYNTEMLTLSCCVSLVTLRSVTHT